MAGFDFDAALRWARFDPRKTLARRKEGELPFISEDRVGGGAPLLDTCVYIDQMQGRTPDLVDVLIAAREANHSQPSTQPLPTPWVSPDGNTAVRSRRLPGMRIAVERDRKRHYEGSIRSRQKGWSSCTSSPIFLPIGSAFAAALAAGEETAAPNTAGMLAVGGAAALSSNRRPLRRPPTARTLLA